VLKESPSDSHEEDAVQDDESGILVLVGRVCVASTTTPPRCCCCCDLDVAEAEVAILAATCWESRSCVRLANEASLLLVLPV